MYKKSESCNVTSLPQGLDWCIRREAPNYAVVCYNNTIHHSVGLWQVQNPTDESLPAFDLQLSLVLSLNLILIFIFKYFGLPRFSAEMLGGCLLGPTIIGRATFIFPYNTMMTLETVAYISLIYYMFLVGLEVDLKPVFRAGRKPLTIALIGILIPIPIGFGLHSMMTNTSDFEKPDDVYGGRMKYGPMFWGFTLATTNFPDLAWILSDLKLLHLEIGRLALSSAVITDLFSWILLVLSTAIGGDTAVSTIVSSFVFVAICLVALRPLLAWLSSKYEDNNVEPDELHVYYVLAAVPLFGFITDACGCQSMLGAFMLGVIMPKGMLKKALVDKSQDFIIGIMMPLFFLIVGLRTNIRTLFDGHRSLIVIFTVIVLSFAAKILSTFIAAVCFNNMSSRDGLALGFIMNTKGLVSLIILNAGRDLKVLSNETFSLMIISFWIMTTAVPPIVSKTYKPNKKSGKNECVSIKSLREDSELRILTCIHNPRNVSSFINLLEASNPTKQSPIRALAVHLVENTGRASAMLILNDECKTSVEEINELPQIHFMNSFENLEMRNSAVRVQQLTAVSSYSTIHKDICAIAEENRVSLIVAPFHKQPSDVETMSALGEKKGDSPLRDVNRNVMNNAQCSVAIFVDRGLSSSSAHKHHHHDQDLQLRYCMLFIGGPDDREALAYALRMSKNPNAILSVIRIVQSESNGDQVVTDESQNLHDQISIDSQKEADDKFMEEMKFKCKDSPSVEFLEKAVNDSNDVMKMVGALDAKCDLFFVGRGRGTLSPLMKVLSDWIEFPELGPLGDCLVTSSFMSEASVLIIQQGSSSAEVLEEAGDQGQLKEHTAGRMTLSVPEVEAPQFAPFVQHRGISSTVLDR